MVLEVARENHPDGTRMVAALASRELGDRAVNRKRVQRLAREHRLLQRREEFETLDEAREKIGRYIDHYHHRPHSRLAYKTPREVAATWKDHEDQLTPAPE